MSRDRDLSPLGPKSDAVLGARALLEAKERRRSGRFLAEGPQAVEAALAAELVDSLYTTELDSGLAVQAKRAGVRVYFIDERALVALSDTVSPQGPIAVARVPSADLEAELQRPGTWLVCDRISDPGNLGTMIRTAAAAGARGVVTTSGSADPWSGKVVRATAGTFTMLPIVSGLDAAVVAAAFKAADVPLLATSGDASVDYAEAASRHPIAKAWVIGSEAHGVSEELASAAEQSVRIPMRAGVESLNAAIAAALCLYATGPVDTDS